MNDAAAADWASDEFAHAIRVLRLKHYERLLITGLLSVARRHADDPNRVGLSPDGSLVIEAAYSEIARSLNVNPHAASRAGGRVRAGEIRYVDVFDESPGLPNVFRLRIPELRRAISEGETIATVFDRAMSSRVQSERNSPNIN